MSEGLQKFKETLERLCVVFEENRHHYRRDRLDETSLRLEYLDPFFSALGWDVSNNLRHPPHLREVRVEYRTQDGQKNRRADYVFRTNGLDRFVCEAKKYPEQLESGHYQVQNYVFNLRMWVGIITNFDQLHVCVVGGKPDQSRPFPPVWRLHSSEYVQSAERIWNLLCRDAVADGSLERFIQALPKASPRSGKQLLLIKPDRNRTVDADFLQYLETERARLARSLVRDNPTIKWNRSGLNEAVQRILDRLLFQRVCEDRGIDTFQPLRKALEQWEAAGRRKGDLWSRITSNYGNLRAAFNGGLYGKVGEGPHLIEKCNVNDHWLEDFIEHLSGDASPYLFSALPVEILGSVYERFLGSVVDEKGNVQQKPEIRRQGGVFYTPLEIVRRIVDTTVGRLSLGKSPDQLRRLKIIDPACGSGTFLIQAFEILCRRYVEFYYLNPKERDPKVVYIGKDGDLHLTSEMKKTIATNSIFGTDIDSQAVEVAEMSIFLKVLEEEDQSSLGKQKALFPNETFLPDLSKNIKVGNSLVDVDAFHLLGGQPSVSELKPFSWENEFSDIMSKGGFDAVIGNPPYDVLEKVRGMASWPHDLFRTYLDLTDRLDAAKGGKLNLFRFFLIQALQLAKLDGHIGMIIPMSLLADISCRSTRLAFLDGGTHLDIDAFPQKDNANERVFHEAKLSTAVVSSVKRRSSKKGEKKVDPIIRLNVYPRNTYSDQSRQCSMKLSELSALDPIVLPIAITDQASWDLASRLHRSNSIQRLGDLAGVVITRGEINQTIYRKFITSDPSHSRLLKGAEVGQYRIKSILSQGSVEWLDAKRLAKKKSIPARVSTARIATQRITGVDERLRLVACMAEAGWFFADSTNSISLLPECSYTAEYLLGLINSRLFQWRFKLTSTNNNVGTNEIEAMPVRIIDFQNRADCAIHDSIVAKVKSSTRLARDIETSLSERTKESAQRMFQQTLDAIDQDVFDLYSLKTSERAVVMTFDC